MNRPLLFSAFGLGLVLLACSGATTGEQTGATDDELSRAKAACLGKACGDTCKLCPTGAINCFETLELKECNAQGRCTSAPAQCALDAGPGPNPIDAGPGPIDAGPAPYEPCGGKSCGDTCSICSPFDPNCVETAVLKFCHSNGACLATPPACIPPPPYDACGGKACGDPCTVCNPLDPNCFETAVLKQCDATGKCTASVAVCN